MAIEREAVVEAVVSAAAVVAFVALIVVIAVAYPTLAGQGAFALIGAIVLFVLVMAAIGYWLSGRQ
jgi:protein-S-isoprenylcysteine O-methyltransferase Ste14